jgi:hypothetical protein
MKKILVRFIKKVRRFFVSEIFIDNAFNRNRGTETERADRPRTFMRRWHIQQRVIK